MKSIIIACFILWSSVAFSEEQVTRFNYKEKGFVGGMLVVNERNGDIPIKPIAVSIHTGNTKTHHTCELRAWENTAARIDSDDSLSITMRISDDGKNLTGETFNIVFRKSGATITYISTPMSTSCGVTATFSGRWQRTRELQHF